MLFNNLALFGALVLLPVASGQFQPFGIPGHDCGGGGFPQTRNGRRFPPMQSNHGFPHATNSHPHPPPHHGLRHRRMANETTDWEMIPTTAPPPVTPRIDCGENPLVRQAEGCPCFSLVTITGQFADLKSADYCELYASKPVDENDPCKHLYPPSYGFFYASTYTETEDYSVYFGYDGHYDPDMEGGYCHAEISDYLFKDNNGDAEGESHGYYLGSELSQMELQTCIDVIEELKDMLGDNQNCLVQIGSGYYY